MSKLLSPNILFDLVSDALKRHHFCEEILYLLFKNISQPLQIYKAKQYSITYTSGAGIHEYHVGILISDAQNT